MSRPDGEADVWIARITNLDAPAYLLRRSGRLRYDDGEEQPCLLIALRVLGGGHASLDGASDLEHDVDLDKVDSELRSGTFDWYGDRLTLDWLTGDEKTLAYENYWDEGDLVSRHQAPSHVEAGCPAWFRWPGRGRGR